MLWLWKRIYEIQEKSAEIDFIIRLPHVAAAVVVAVVVVIVDVDVEGMKIKRQRIKFSEREIKMIKMPKHYY